MDLYEHMNGPLIPLRISGLDMETLALVGIMTLLAFVACLAWLTWTVSVPPGVPRSWLLRILLMAFVIAELINKVLVWSGQWTQLEIDRAGMDMSKKPIPKKHPFREIKDVVLEGVRVRLYIPEVSEGQGHRCVVYIHGGGFCLGDSEGFDAISLRVARDVPMVIASVGYRLAPEVTYPEPLDDCVIVTKYVLTHAHEYGGDTERVAVIGDSAGGNLAAATLLRLRDEKFQPLPACHALLYPALQCLDFHLPSMVQNERGPILTRRMMARFWSLYMAGDESLTQAMLDNGHTSQLAKGDVVSRLVSHDMLGDQYKYSPYHAPLPGPPGDVIWREISDKVTSSYLCPLVCEDLRHLPPCFVMTCQYDILRDEGMLYAERLRQAGVDVELYNMTNGYHAVASIDVLPGCDVFLERLVEYLARKL